MAFSMQICHQTCWHANSLTRTLPLTRSQSSLPLSPLVVCRLLACWRRQQLCLGLAHFRLTAPPKLRAGVAGESPRCDAIRLLLNRNRWQMQMQTLKLITKILLLAFKSFKTCLKSLALHRPFHQIAACASLVSHAIDDLAFAGDQPSPRSN